MATFNFTDIYIRYDVHPLYNSSEITQDDIILVIVQKVEMILFTNKGELLGDPNFGSDLERFLHETNVSAGFVKKELISQFQTYIPELNSISYVLDVRFMQHPTQYMDMLFIDFKIRDVEVNAFFN